MNECAVSSWCVDMELFATETLKGGRIITSSVTGCYAAAIQTRPRETQRGENKGKRHSERLWCICVM